MFSSLPCSADERSLRKSPLASTGQPNGRIRGQRRRLAGDAPDGSDDSASPGRPSLFLHAEEWRGELGHCRKATAPLGKRRCLLFDAALSGERRLGPCWPLGTSVGQSFRGHLSPNLRARYKSTLARATISPLPSVSLFCVGLSEDYLLFARRARPASYCTITKG